MRFGVGLTPYSRFPDMDSLRITVQSAERLGFHAVSIGDHVVIPNSHVKTLSPVWYDPLVLGAAIAACTKTIRILFNTLVAPYHHPIALAKSIASLDVLSGGRVTAGIGVGWIEEEFKALGVPFQDRGAITDEWIRAMKELWTSPRPSFDGRYVSFGDIAFEPRPLQLPHPPIIIGGGVHRTLQRAAVLGDGWHPLGRTWARLRSDVDELRRLLEEQGRQAEGFPMSYTLYHGSVAGQTSRHTRRAGGEEATVLSGDPSEALDQIQKFDDLGFGSLTIRFRGLSHRELGDAMERFHAQVIDPLRQIG